MLMSRRLWFFVLVPLALLLPPALPTSAQITTNTALPVSEGQGLVRVQSTVIRATGSGPMDRALTVYGVPFLGAYGATQDLTVFGVVPLLHKTLDVTTPQGRVERGPTGLGDVRLFARYTVWARNRAGETQRLAPLAGIELPTGADDETDDLGRLPRPLQLGSGSWDPFAGAVFTWQTLRWQVDVSPVYQVNTEADGVAFGDEARLDVASKYRLWANDRSGGVPGFLYGNLETNLIWQGENEIRGVENPNSGGTAWLVAPGLQYITRKVVVEGAVQLPALQDGNGTALEEAFIAILSLRVNI
jgi:hypothetical protein